MPQTSEHVIVPRDQMLALVKERLRHVEGQRDSHKAILEKYPFWQEKVTQAPAPAPECIMETATITALTWWERTILGTQGSTATRDGLRQSLMNYGTGRIRKHTIRKILAERDRWNTAGAARLVASFQTANAAWRDLREVTPPERVAWLTEACGRLSQCLRKGLKLSREHLDILREGMTTEIAIHIPVAITATPAPVLAATNASTQNQAPRRNRATGRNTARKGKPAQG